MGKMFKYDMKSIWRPLFPFMLGMFGITLLGCLFCRYLNNFLGVEPDTPFAKILLGFSGVYMVILGLSFAAFGLISIIFILKRYYENFFTDEGYLTFTLPVKASSLLSSKLVSGSISLIICEIFEAFCILVFVLLGMSSKGIIDEEVMDVVRELFSIAFSRDYIFITIELVILVMIFTVFQTGFFQLCITIGSIIAKKHKILASVGVYYGANFILSSVSNVIAIIFIFNAEYFDTMYEYIPMVHSTLLLICLVFAGASVGTYFLNKFLLTKKLNLN